MALAIAYYCGGSVRTLPWGFQISYATQAIIVSNVTERGMSWWRNGSFAGQNAPHTVPKDYQFHGTFNPVYAGNDIDYSDYMTFRHNVGSGGTGSLTVAAGSRMRGQADFGWDDKQLRTPRMKVETVSTP